MKATEIMSRSFRSAWNNKKLWVFGIFVAAASSGSGNDDGGSGGLAAGSLETLPPWVWVLIAVAGVIALVALVMNIISESALIAGIERTRREGDRTFGIKDGFGFGLRYFKPVFSLKILFGIADIASIAVVSIPVLLSLFGVVGTVTGIVFSVLLALPAIPWLLTLHFMRQYALRLAVLEGCGVMEAIRGAHDHLHGRIGQSLMLLGVNVLGAFAVSTAAVVLLLPAAALGGLAYLVGGLVPAIVVAATLAVPVAFATAGALGTYRSSVWTHGYLESVAVGS